VSGDGLGEQHRPWCCPEPRCTPVHTLQGSDKPLSIAEPGETFVCFGAAPTVEFVYDGVRHVNDTRAYSRAVLALLRFRDGDQGARNPDRNLIADETDVSR
jgi:hypothetical protein